MLSLCRSSVQNTRASKLKISFSPSGPARSMAATAARVARRVTTKRTHLLNLPLYEGPGVMSRMEELRRLWRQGAESVGLEPSIIMPSIHHAMSIKLGNINIKGAEASPITASFDPNAAESQEEPPAFERDEVVQVLQGLKDPIRQLLASTGSSDVLRVPLGDLIPLLHGRQENFNPNKVNVLFLRPAEGQGLDIVSAISALVHERFTAAGMLAGSPSVPAIAKATLINTANRQSYVPAPGHRRKPFKLQALYQVDGFNQFRPENAETLPSDIANPLRLDLGVAEVRSLLLEPVGSGVRTTDGIPQCEADVTFAI
ncbi:hypothetical protein JB92DRAFT_2897686 [Gautieria morchelliformis]|nr:hypothetical protein JB92DRAFT_2897686 [Gautieria morchelliformis]